MAIYAGLHLLFCRPSSRRRVSDLIVQVAQAFLARVSLECELGHVCTASQPRKGNSILGSAVLKFSTSYHVLRCSHYAGSEREAGGEVRRGCGRDQDMTSLQSATEALTCTFFGHPHVLARTHASL